MGTLLEPFRFLFKIMEGLESFLKAVEGGINYILGPIIDAVKPIVEQVTEQVGKGYLCIDYGAPHTYSGLFR